MLPTLAPPSGVHTAEEVGSFGTGSTGNKSPFQAGCIDKHQSGLKAGRVLALSLSRIPRQSLRSWRYLESDLSELARLGRLFGRESYSIDSTKRAAVLDNANSSKIAINPLGRENRMCIPLIRWCQLRPYLAGGDRMAGPLYLRLAKPGQSHQRLSGTAVVSVTVPAAIGRMESAAATALSATMLMGMLTSAWGSLAPPRAAAALSRTMTLRV